MTTMTSHSRGATAISVISVDFGEGGTNDTGVKMMQGTSPSIDDNDDVAFQGTNGDLWIWKPGGTSTDTGLGMMTGTSPSISRDRASGAPLAGTPGNDRLNGSPRNDVIRGGRGNDRIRGGAGNDKLYGGPGNDRIYGGPGQRPISPPKTRSSTSAAPPPCSRDQEPIGSTSPIAAATIGWCARPVRLTTSLPTGAIASRAGAGARGGPSATCAAGSRAARTN